MNCLIGDWMNNFPVLYTALTVLFAGISLCALLQFLYMYFVLRRGETLFAVVSGCAVFMYILSDICGIIFTYARPDSGRAEFFILFRETAVIFFYNYTSGLHKQDPRAERSYNKSQ